MEDFQSWKSVIENIYFPCHTLKFRKLSLWKGKSTVRTVCTTNFRSVRKYFDEYFDGLLFTSYLQVLLNENQREQNDRMLVVNIGIL